MQAQSNCMPKSYQSCASTRHEAAPVPCVRAERARERESERGREQESERERKPERERVSERARDVHYLQRNRFLSVHLSLRKKVVYRKIGWGGFCSEWG